MNLSFLSLRLVSAGNQCVTIKLDMCVAIWQVAGLHDNHASPGTFCSGELLMFSKPVTEVSPQGEKNYHCLSLLLFSYELRRFMRMSNDKGASSCHSADTTSTRENDKNSQEIIYGSTLCDMTKVNKEIKYMCEATCAKEPLQTTQRQSLQCVCACLRARAVVMTHSQPHWAINHTQSSSVGAMTLMNHELYVVVGVRTQTW